MQVRRSGRAGYASPCHCSRLPCLRCDVAPYRRATSTSSLENCNLKKSPQWTWPFGLLLGRRVGNGRTFVAVDARYSVALSDTFDGAFMQNYTWCSS